MSALETNVLVPALPTDILTVILEEVLRLKMSQCRYRCYHPEAWNSFLSLRLLSRQMSDLVVPVCYREIYLGRGILECFITCFKIESETASERSRYLHTPEIIRAQYKVAEYVRTYTQHVLITDEDLARSWVPDMLSHLTNLKHLTWSYWGGFSDGVEPSIQYEVLANPAFRAVWPKEAALLYPLLVDLVSCTDGGYRYTGISTDFAIQIKDVLLASPEMEVFDMAFKKSENGTVDWNIKHGERLPAFKDLKLYEVDWDYSSVKVIDFWGWSRITHLRLNKVPIMPFLKTVTPEYLSGLHTFQTDSYGSENSMEEAIRLLCNFVGKIVNLEGLAMKIQHQKSSGPVFPSDHQARSKPSFACPTPSSLATG